MNQKTLVGGLIAALLAAWPAFAQAPGLEAPMSRIEAALSGSDWQATQQPWTGAMVKQVADLFGEKAKAERAVRSWKEGRSLVWQSRTRPGQIIALSAVRHDSESAARGYFGFAVDLQRKQDEVGGKNCGPFFQVLETKSQAVTLPGIAEAVRTDKRVKQAGEFMNVTVVLARAGDMVIECDWYETPADMNWAARLIAELRK